MGKRIPPTKPDLPNYNSWTNPNLKPSSIEKNSPTNHPNREETVGVVRVRVSEGPDAIERGGT